MYPAATTPPSTTTLPTQPDSNSLSPSQNIESIVLTQDSPSDESVSLTQRSASSVEVDNPKSDIPAGNNLEPKAGWGVSVPADTAKQALTEIYSLTKAAWVKTIGNGAAAAVMKVKINATDYAVKLPPKFPHSVTEDISYKTNKGEVCGLKVPPHKHIVQTHALLLLNQITQKYHLISDLGQIPEGEQTKYRVRACIQDLAKGEELYDLLDKGLFPKGVKEAVHVCLQVASALQHLHGHGFIYRDLKPANILYDSETRDIKLVDFGSLKSVSLGNTTKTFCGSWDYLAPEVLQEKDYNHTVDNLALGWVLYELATGKPFYGEKDQFTGARERCAYSSNDHSERQRMLMKESEEDFQGRGELMHIVSQLTGSPPNERMSLPDTIAALEALQKEVVTG